MRTIIGSLFLIISFSIVDNMSMSKDFYEYGPYEASYLRYETCRGPKAKNVTSWATTTLFKQKNIHYGKFNISFPAPTRLYEIKVTVYFLKDNKKNLLWTYKLENPCAHFAFGFIIENFLKSQNCVVNKGNYIFNLNLDENGSTFLGKSFFYGDFMFKTNLMSKQGNIMCIVCVQRNSKKT